MKIRQLNGIDDVLLLHQLHYSRYTEIVPSLEYIQRILSKTSTPKISPERAYFLFKKFNEGAIADKSKFNNDNQRDVYKLKWYCKHFDNLKTYKIEIDGYVLYLCNSFLYCTKNNHIEYAIRYTYRSYLTEIISYRDNEFYIEFFKRDMQKNSKCFLYIDEVLYD